MQFFIWLYNLMIPFGVTIVFLTGLIAWLWLLGYVLDKCISKWLNFIGAWHAIIEALMKRSKVPKRTVMK